MRFIYLVFLLLFNFNLLHSDPGVMGTIRGLGTVVKEPAYNPMVGSVSGNYLKGLRYYGNYSSDNQERKNPLLKCSVKKIRNPQYNPADPNTAEFKPDNCPQDVVTSLIQWLFPNATLDGNFAPNRRAEDFKDLVSTFTPATIGRIMNAIYLAKNQYDEKLIASIEKAILEQYTTDYGQKEMASPISAMKNEQQIYKEYTQKYEQIKTDSFPTVESVIDHKKQIGKKMSQLMRDDTLSPEQKKQQKKILIESNPTIEQITVSRQFQTELNKARKAALTEERGPAVKAQKTELDTKYKNQPKVFSQIVVAALSMAKRPSSLPPKMPSQVKATLTQTEVNADLNRGVKTQNPKLPSQDNIPPSQKSTLQGESYHPMVIEMALLHFAWRISKTKADIVQLLEKMPNLVSQADLEAYKKSNRAYTHEEYLIEKNKKLSPDKMVETFQGSIGLEKAVFLGIGYRQFEGSYPSRIGYGQVKLFKKKFNALDKKQEAYKLKRGGNSTDTLPDCGSSSLRNVFNFITYNMELQKFDLSQLEKKAKAEGLTPKQELLDFYNDHGTLDTVLTYAARADWIRVTSFLKNSIEYVKKTDTSKSAVCEVDVGVTNMMKVIGGLLGIPGQTLPLSSQTVDMSNLDKLLELVSTDNRKWDWKEQESNQKTIPSSKDKNVNIDFYLANTKIFTWTFQQGHFDTIVHVSQSQNWIFDIGSQLLNNNEILPVYSTLFADKSNIFGSKNLRKLTSKNASYYFYSANFADVDMKLLIIERSNNPALQSFISLNKRLVNSLIDLANSDQRTAQKLLETTAYSNELFSLVVKALHINTINKITSLHLKKLEFLPESIGKLTSLKELHFKDNKLESLPESFGKLTSLETLYLNNNELSSLPESIGKLTSLKNLILAGNELESLPESFEKLTSLESLILNNNKLSSLPESIGKLTSLKNLILAGNKLESLPESFEKLTSLESLILNNNKLSSLPESFGKLTSLKDLHLNDNELSSLPESFGKLTSLETLFLDNNKLSSLPESIGKLTSLIIFHLDGNYLTIKEIKIGSTDFKIQKQKPSNVQ